MREYLLLIMSSITDDEVRWRILEILAEESRKKPSVWGVHRSTIQESLGIPEKNMDYNMVYLAQNGLVKLVQVQSSVWLWAKLTLLGMDVLENRSFYEERFPFVKAALLKERKNK
ncbi:hypothetical protein CW712_06765 [Candidatus Bathyarchaeota archaeon]|nr:MAG: hypothetical protein CW712_06765 [Candidatus Bathyarchaeota archaeon]